MKEAATRIVDAIDTLIAAHLTGIPSVHKARPDLGRVLAETIGETSRDQRPALSGPTEGAMKEDPRLDPVTRRIYFEYVDAHGYPNGLPTWDELIEHAKTDKNDLFFVTIIISMAEGALEVIDHLAKKE